jgi:hypothetical protein
MLKRGDMALKLTVILLLLVFAVLQFGGRDTGQSPFAELPGAEPAEVLLAVAPLDVPLEVATPPAESPVAPAPDDSDSRPSPTGSEPPATETASRTGAEDTAVPTQSALDMIVMDPAAARDSLTVAPPARINPATITATGPLAPATDAATGPVPNETLAATEPDGGLAEVTGSSVNLRAGPSTGNAILGRAAEGDVVEWVADPAPGWALIRHPEIDGELYMSSQFLRRIDN